MSIFKYQSLFIISIFLFLPLQLKADTLIIAVASNFAPILEELVEDFESLYAGSKLVLVSGSSGKAYAQIKHGAPFDMFMSADQDKPSRLVKEGLAHPESLFTYALGRLVLWSADPKLISSSNDVLEKGAFHKIALANSKLAPYGLASEQVLQALGLLRTYRSKWVQGENIAQTYQFVKTKNADLGFISKSQVWKNNNLVSGSAWVIPEHLYSPIQQDAVVLKASKNHELANKVIRFLKSADTRHKIESYGYQSTENSNIEGVH